jgi:hypothetical protein
MGGDLVEKKDRQLTPAIGDEVGVGQDEAKQKRFLLTCRGLRCRHLLGAMENDEVVAVGTFSRPAGGGVAGPVGL